MLFRKKAKSGIATPKKEIDLVHRRLEAAERDYRERERQNEGRKKKR
jgi:phage-related protein